MKVGDKVRVINPDYSILPIGEITNITADQDWPVEVIFPEDEKLAEQGFERLSDIFNFAESELELVD